MEPIRSSASLPSETDARDASRTRLPDGAGARSFDERLRERRRIDCFVQQDWYVLRVRSRAEFRVRDALGRAGFETFLPTWIETVRWSDRSKQTTRAIFTGYVFTRFARFSEASAVLGIAGVIQILGHDHLSSIPNAEIENIRRVASLPAVPVPYVAAGTAVVISSGPLQGVTGRVVKTKGACRLIVSVEMLGQSCAVTIDAADCKPEKP